MERMIGRTISRGILVVLPIALCMFAIAPQAAAGGDAPQWMHTLVGATTPSYDEKTDAVLLYSEINVTVFSEDKVRTHVREAYKILRPEGRERGTVRVHFDPTRKIANLHGWCIPGQGKDYEVKDKDTFEVSANQGFELYSDEKFRVLQIPAPEPGNIVGYEYEVEERPFFLQDTWYFQQADPVRESRFSLQLPAGWAFKASWFAHADVKPNETNGNVLQWVVSDVSGMRPEPDMPPWQGLAGQMIVSYFPAGGASRKNEFVNWDGMAGWYRDLISGRMDASEPIKQQISSLTAGQTAVLPKMQAIAGFMQREIRYVAIQLGIGGWQPHSAPDVFSHRYGDCKDKATLMRTMLREIGVESYHVVIYTERGAVTQSTPPHHGFNHAILAIKLPDGVNDLSLTAVIQHPKLGRILFFDPTDEITPFGQIRGPLQSNYALLVTPDGGELVELPQQPSAMNSIQRVGKLTLEVNGVLKGGVTETRLGDRAQSERARLRNVTKEADRIK